MARLIDADRLHDCIMDNDIHSGIMSLKNVYEFIDEQPTIDAVPVVRCKDCTYFNAKNSLETQGICMCGEKEMNYGGEFYPFADDFCSYGKRKEETE